MHFKSVLWSNGGYIFSILICKKMCNIKIFINWQFIGAKAEVYISFAFSRHQLLFEYVYKSVILNNKIFLTLLLHDLDKSTKICSNNVSLVWSAFVEVKWLYICNNELTP